MYVKAVSTRFGLAAIWAEKEDGTIELFRLEQLGRRVVTRKVLWGDHSAWNEEARKAAEVFREEKSAGKADFREFITVLIVQPLMRGQCTVKVEVNNARLKGSVNGFLFDIDLYQ